MSTDFDLKKSCKDIHDSWGQRHGDSIRVRVLARRNRNEREKIREIYKASYGEDLVEKLENNINDFDGGIKEIMRESYLLVNKGLYLWMVDPNERDAVMAKKELEEDNTNFKALIEIYVGRKSSQIFLIKQAYQRRFKTNLEQDIITAIDPPHSYQKILAALSTSHKGHNANISEHIAKCDAKRLFEIGKSTSSSSSLLALEESIILEILSKRSIPQLKLTFASYHHIYGHHFTKTLKRQNHGEFENSLLTVIKCIYNPPKYYAKMLYRSIGKGSTTTTDDSKALERVILSRAEIDLDEIQSVLKEKYGIELTKAICETISCGDYRDFLVALASKSK